MNFPSTRKQGILGTLSPAIPVSNPVPVKETLFGYLSGAMIVRGFALASTLVFTSVLSFLIPKAEYGMVAAMMSLVLFVSAFGEFGQRELMARDVSKALTMNDHADARRLASLATIITGIGGSVSALAVVAFLLVIGDGWILALIGGVLTILLSINAALSGIGRAYGQFVIALAPREVFWRILAVVGVAILYWLGLGPDATITAFMLLVSLALCLVLQFVMLGKPTFDLTPGITSHIRTIGSNYLWSSFDIAIKNISSLLLATVDVIAVGVILGSTTVAEYFPSNRIAVLSIYFFLTINLLLGPRFARSAKEGNFNEISRISALLSMASLIFSIFILVAIVFSEPLLPYVFDTATTATWLSTLILVSGQTISTAIGFGSTALVAANHEKTVRRIMVWSIAIAVPAIVLSTYAMGVLGTAVAVSIISVARATIVAHASKQKLGFTGGAFDLLQKKR